MQKNKFRFSSHSDFLMLSAINAGGALEWFEIGMFVFWQSIVQGEEASFDLPIAESLNATVILLLILKILAFGGMRAFGGWFFGRRGDLRGRKTAFPLTILFSTFPSWGVFILSFILPYQQWITYSVGIFALAKFFQGMPAGGEIPGAICYLAETAVAARKISTKSQFVSIVYKCSFALLGPQIGLALSALVCLILRFSFPSDILLTYGWRYVFFGTAMAGLGGYALRHLLSETIVV